MTTPTFTGRLPSAKEAQKLRTIVQRSREDAKRAAMDEDIQKLLNKVVQTMGSEEPNDHQYYVFTLDTREIKYKPWTAIMEEFEAKLVAENYIVKTKRESKPWALEPVYSIRFKAPTEDDESNSWGGSQ